MNTFKNALNNFTFSYAAGDAIKKLARDGYSLTEIKKHLDYPVSDAKIGETVFSEYVSIGKIFLDTCPTGDEIEIVDYVKEQNAYGRISMKRVVKKRKLPGTEYVPVDIGIRKYKKSPEFVSSLERLSSEDLKYVLDLPWPCQKVYHVKDEQITRILDIIKP
ncbi:MAG: hypothetical protein KBS85_00140 [Lachnospiraceae bacterium]|nr:hypothetical protein [Candidatus Merdinaster equi]